MQTIVVILALVLGYVLGLYILAPSAVEESQRMQFDRIRRHHELAKTQEKADRSFAERFIRPLVDGIIRSLLRYMPQGTNKALLESIEQAGNPTTPGMIMFVRILMILVFMLPMALGGMMVAFSAILMILAWRLPVFWLEKRITKRKQDFLRQLPDVLDLLSVSVEAGLGFDAALQHVVDRFPDPISSEFKRLLREIQLGRPRAQALRDLTKRIQIADLEAFVSAVVQADELGVGITAVLRSQSEQMRVVRRQRAQESALKVPLKLLFPLIMLIFPAMFLVLLGPAVLSFVTVIKHP